MATPAASAIPRCARSPRVSARLISARTARLERPCLSSRNASRRASHTQGRSGDGRADRGGGRYRIRLTRRAGAVRSTGPRNRPPATAWRSRRAIFSSASSRCSKAATVSAAAARHRGGRSRDCAPWVSPTPRLPRSRTWRARSIEGMVPDRGRTGSAARMRRSSNALTQVRGIGRWTVEMMLMFQLRAPGRAAGRRFRRAKGFRLAYGLKGMPTTKALAEFGERWKPYRSIAAWYLWRASGSGETEPVARSAPGHRASSCSRYPNRRRRRRNEKTPKKKRVGRKRA